MPGWEGGSTRAWRKLRKAILTRDHYRCRVQLSGTCTTVADCVHHLDGKTAGDDPRRLVASCTPCNLAIGNPSRTTSGQPRDPEPRTSTTW